MEQLTFGFAGDERESVAFFTVAEAARHVRCCERTIRRAIDSGALLAGRIGARDGSRGGFRIRSAALSAQTVVVPIRRRQPGRPRAVARRRDGHA
jgi:hypothetical protein